MKIVMKQVHLKATIIRNFSEPWSLKCYWNSKFIFMTCSCLEKNPCNLFGFIIEVKVWSNIETFAYSFFVQSFKIIFWWWWWWTGQIRGATLSTDYWARVIVHLALISKRHFPRRLDVPTGLKLSPLCHIRQKINVGNRKDQARCFNNPSFPWDNKTQLTLCHSFPKLC